MKRSWIGLAMLVVLLVIALLVTWGMDRIHEPIARELELAADCALTGQWEKAQILASSAGTEWEKWAHFRGCFADHSPMEEVDAEFARLMAYSAAGEEAEFAASCSALSKKVKAMGEAHGLSWWNVV